MVDKPDNFSIYLNNLYSHNLNVGRQQLSPAITSMRITNKRPVKFLIVKQDGEEIDKVTIQVSLF
ncbi:hypothetical protein [Ferruginibacter sp.]|uniref:hypothetical protein n=1 Tax=Ferruginibacter sp. TaxID=1940288 RepID=UPI002659C7AD|nr:hypothetical protein [Ferruginibacter sp.]